MLKYTTTLNNTTQHEGLCFDWTSISFYWVGMLPLLAPIQSPAQANITLCATPDHLARKSFSSLISPLPFCFSYSPTCSQFLLSYNHSSLSIQAILHLYSYFPSVFYYLTMWSGSCYDSTCLLLAAASPQLPQLLHELPWSCNTSPSTFSGWSLPFPLSSHSAYQGHQWPVLSLDLLSTLIYLSVLAVSSKTYHFLCLNPAWHFSFLAPL